VPRLRRSQRMRPWIAMVVAYALVLQVALSGMLASRVIAADNVSLDSQFSICHSSSKADDSQQGGAGEPQNGQTHCLLCVLVSGSSAVLPASYASTIVTVETASGVDPRSDDRIDEYHSPTGQYPRGPPTGVHTVG
jgi:hypothetical protein